MPRAKKKDAITQATFPGAKFPPALEIALVQTLRPGDDLPPERWVHAMRLRAARAIAYWAGLINAAGKSGPVHEVNTRRVRGGRQGRTENTLLLDAIKGLRSLWAQSPGSRQAPQRREFEFVWTVVKATRWKDDIADAVTRRHEFRRLFRDPRCSLARREGTTPATPAAPLPKRR